MSQHKRYLSSLCFLFFLLNTIVGFNYEYELSRGRLTWQGSGHAVHYMDHFTLLTDEIAGIKGLMTSHFSFNTNRQFSLTFRLNQIGKMVNDKEGFMMVFSPDNVNLMLKNDNSSFRADFLQAAVSLIAIEERY